MADTSSTIFTGKKKAVRSTDAVPSLCSLHGSKIWTVMKFVSKELFGVQALDIGATGEYGYSAFVVNSHLGLELFIKLAFDSHLIVCRRLVANAECRL